MSNNIQAYPDNFDWFLHNHDIADKSVEIIAKDLQLFTRS